MPVLDSIPEDEKTTDYFLSFLARELSVEKSDIIDFELNTFCMEEPCFVGVNDTMISSPRIDNQSSCRALLDAIEDGNRADGINIIARLLHTKCIELKVYDIALFHGQLSSQKAKEIIRGPFILRY